MVNINEIRDRKWALIKAKLDDGLFQKSEAEIKLTICTHMEDAMRDAIAARNKEVQNTHTGDNQDSGGGRSMGEDFYSSEDYFPFGKYGPKGQAKTFGEIPSHYYEWLGGQEWIKEWPGVSRYINGEDAPPPAANPYVTPPASDDPDEDAPF